ncbi:LytTR family DNA-binding domain-containing protein [Porphyrobacter sp. AAP82]|uniref:LytTR family DNA-binding domain-containing protein n=1 Tax=Porphyrobacter sp. AAP82 TaxID=1248917 RepID=UPI0002F77F02|nr:LytTR family DNA-binding domain-containing protein [Porphyrobacter sp. AAP82]
MAEAGVVALVAVVVAVFDLLPFGEVAPGARLALSLAGFLAAWLVYLAAARVGIAVARLLGLADYWGHALAVPFVGVAVTYGVLGLVGGPRAMFGGQFGAVWVQALMVAAGFFALFFVLYVRAEHARLPESVEPVATAETLPPSAPVPGVAASALHQRLDPDFPAILALAAEDHYVRVIAEAKSALVLMPLAEAAALMPEGSGAQVHRSWWVAKSAVTGQRRTGRDLQLVLHGGLAAPVSRSRIAELREAGWISP